MLLEERTMERAVLTRPTVSAEGRVQGNDLQQFGALKSDEALNLKNKFTDSYSVLLPTPAQIREEGVLMQRPHDGSGRGREERREEPAKPLVEHWEGEERQGVSVTFSHKRLGDIELTVEDVFGEGLSIGVSGMAGNRQLEAELRNELRAAKFAVSKVKVG
jgi:hypothetical protein